MALPDPYPGLVVTYRYLWRREHKTGWEEGSKDRPCAIVLSVRTRAGETLVTVAPITHSAPDNPDDAIELPSATKVRLGLDSERSWIVLTEVNRFIWPGPDLRPISRQTPTRFAYGVLPPDLFDLVTRRLRDLAKRRRVFLVSRSD